MPYPLPSDFFKNLPQTLRQPVWIATLTSIGLHGLFAIVAPILPLSSQTPEKDKQRTVQLVQLTPEEQSRVPQFSQPQSAIPNLSQSSPLSTIPLPNQSPLLDPSFSYPDVTTPPPPITFGLGTRDDSFLWNRNGYRQQTGDKDRSGTFTKPKVHRNSRSAGSNQNQPDQNQPDKNEPDQNQPDKNEPDQNQPDKNEPDQGNPNPPTHKPGVPDNIPPGAIAQQQAIREKLTYNGSGRTTEANLASLKSLGSFAVETAKDGKLAKEAIKADKVTGVYPPLACIAKLKSDAQIGVVVDPEGKIVDQPKVVWSSGYGALDEAALQYITKQAKFPAGEDYRMIVIPFDFQPSDAVCRPSKADG